MTLLVAHPWSDNLMVYLLSNSPARRGQRGSLVVIL